MKLHRGRRVMLVTGASGFLGRHLVRGPASQDWEIIAPTSSSMDVTDRAAALDTITGWSPDVVVHLAYRKERRTIVEGTRNVVDASVAARARLVHISTDAVFAGRPTPYTEIDRPDPTIGYGVDKWDAEQIVTDTDPGAAIIRTSLLYGTGLLSPMQFELQRASRTGRAPMAFFTDEFRCPAHADDVARAISTVAQQRNAGGVLHVAGPERVSRLDFARTCARHLDLADLELPSTTIAGSGMTRAANIVLDSSLASTLDITCHPLSAALSE